jgi:hypothetical protein
MQQTLPARYATLSKSNLNFLSGWKKNAKRIVFQTISIFLIVSNTEKTIALRQLKNTKNDSSDFKVVKKNFYLMNIVCSPTTYVIVPFL